MGSWVECWGWGWGWIGAEVENGCGLGLDGGRGSDWLKMGLTFVEGWLGTETGDTGLGLVVVGWVQGLVGVGWGQGRISRGVRGVHGRPWCRTVNDVGL